MTLQEKVKIPSYTTGEEIVNAITHGIGALLSTAGLVLCVVFSALHHNATAVIASSIYGASLILLYVISTVYHSLKVNNGKRVLCIIDHCNIFLLIAGSYTPFVLITLKGAVGWTLFGIIWGSAIIGIILNAINLRKFRALSMVLYLAMGWAIVFALKPLAMSLAPNGIALLVWGGIAYTIGAIFYGLGKKQKYMHSVFHVFVLVGSILQFFSIFFYVI